jgi:hypothetical protein
MAHETLVPEAEHAARPLDTLLLHPPLTPDEQDPPLREELEMHPFCVQATELADPDEEQAEDIATAPRPDDEELAADVQPLRAAGGGVQLEVTRHGGGGGVVAHTSRNREVPKPARMGPEAQVTPTGLAKDAAVIP